MNYTIIFLLRASQELLEVWEWYEDRQLGLGDRFKQEVYNRIFQIEERPERYPERKRNYREISVKEFPYLIVYRINKKEKIVAIVSIFHMRRNPKKKYKKN